MNRQFHNKRQSLTVLPVKMQPSKNQPGWGKGIRKQAQIQRFKEMSLNAYVLEFRLIPNLETVAQRCSVKKIFIKISQKSQGNICPRVSFLIKMLEIDSGTDIFLILLRNF